MAKNHIKSNQEKHERCFECGSKEANHKCIHCEFHFCDKHKTPKIAGMLNFKSNNPKDLLLIEESRKENGHPCILYTKFIEEKRKKELEEYDRALDALSFRNNQAHKEKKIVLGKPISKEKYKKEDEIYNTSLPNYSKKREDYSYKRETRKIHEKVNHFENHKKNKKVLTFFKGFLIILIFLTISFLLINKFIINKKQVNQSNEMSNLVLSEINKVRFEKSLNQIQYDENSYNLATNISHMFYESNRYSLLNSELTKLSKEYGVNQTQILVKKLDNADNSSINLMVLDWTTRDIFTEKTLNKSVNGGAVDCYENICVLILSKFILNPVEIIQEDKQINPKISIQKDKYLEYKTNPKNVTLYEVGKFELYEGLNDYLANLDRSMYYYYTPPTTKDFILRDLDNEAQKEYLMPLVEKIKSETDNPQEQAIIAIRMVQNIPYDWEAFETDSVDGRYPYEVLYDFKGVCMEKADLMAFLLRELGFSVAIFEFDFESHRAVGIKCSNGDYNTNYCFIEATEVYPVGQIPYEYVGGVDIRNANPEVVIISEGYSFNSNFSNSKSPEEDLIELTIYEQKDFCRYYQQVYGDYGLDEDAFKSLCTNAYCIPHSMWYNHHECAGDDLVCYCEPNLD